VSDALNVVDAAQRAIDVADSVRDAGCTPITVVDIGYLRDLLAEVRRLTTEADTMREWAERAAADENANAAGLERLAHNVGAALVAASLAPGESLADPPAHAIVSAVDRLRRERDEARNRESAAASVVLSLDIPEVRRLQGEVTAVRAVHALIEALRDRDARLGFAEAERDEARAALQAARVDGARAMRDSIAAILNDGGFDPWPAVKRTTNLAAWEEHRVMGLDAILDAVLVDAASDVRRLDPATVAGDLRVRE